MLDITKIRSQFPTLERKIHDKPLVYFDNASTTLTPQKVITSLSEYYRLHNANVHRGVHTMSEEATESFEKTRKLTANLINATSSKEIIFTKNTTESINLVAFTWGEKNIKTGDEIIVSEIEHHSNFVPWQQLAIKKGAILKIIPLREDLTLDMEAYKNLLTSNTKLVAISSMSNVLGTKTDIKNIIHEAHMVDALVLIDGAQSVAHSTTDVQDLNCDFLTFSAHKMLGPTGLGILYGKRKHLEKMPPFLLGGSMIKTVSRKETTFAEIPAKFEAGTPPIAEVIAFGETIKYLSEIGMENIAKHEKNLMSYAIEKFSQHQQIKIYTPKNPEKRGPIISFTIKGIHPHDIASIFDQFGIAIRAGHHCAQPLMNKLNIPATARISFYLYNTVEEVDKAEEAIKKILEIFK